MDTYWDQRIEYLRNTRWLYYNDDYLDFFFSKVLKIEQPVNVIDFGCGYGFLGIRILPLLPEGSTYTGIDKGEKLIETAKEYYSGLPYKSDFICVDINEYLPVRKYDVVMCHALLLHVTNIEYTLNKMIRSASDNGKIICFEPHWISTVANFNMENEDQSKILPLGILQKLYENGYKKYKINGNIGIRLPFLLTKLGVKDVQCRVSDKVVFYDPASSDPKNDELYKSIKEEGFARKIANIDEMLDDLACKLDSESEAEILLNAMCLHSEAQTSKSYITWAPTMKITFGSVKKTLWGY